MADKLAFLAWSRVLMFGVFLGAVVFYFNGEEPGAFDAARAQAKQELEASKKLLRDTESSIANAKKFEAEAEAMNRQFNELVQFLPSELNVSELVRTVSEEARKSGAETKRLEPKSKSSERVGFYEMSKIDVQLRGTYSQLVLFLSYLTHVPRLLTFDRVEFTVEPNDASKIMFFGTLVAYRYVQSARDDKQKDGSDRSATPPAN